MPPSLQGCCLSQLVGLMVGQQRMLRLLASGGCRLRAATCHIENAARGSGELRKHSGRVEDLDCRVTACSQVEDLRVVTASWG